MSVSADEKIQTVTGSLNYLDPYSKQSGLFVEPGHHVDAGEYTGYDVQVRNGRPVQDRFTLERNGFTFVQQTCPIDDFTDADRVNEVYVPAALETVREALGADLIVQHPGNAWVARMGNTSGTKAQPVAAQVHVDINAATGKRRFDEIYAANFPDAKPYSRAVMTSFWRVINQPPQDWPLAVCDFQSVQAHEGVDNPLLFVDKTPENAEAARAALAIMDLESINGGSVFYYNPNHEWWYFPEMNRDEALLFTLNDSDQSHAWRCLHSAFRDTGVSDENVRHSIEFRSIAFFH